jgi:Uncharacterized conserved protein
MAESISVAYAKEYLPGAMDRAVAVHFEAHGWDALFSAQTRAVLKPNLLMKRAPERVTTTHPELLAAVVRRLQGLGVRDITLADSPGGPYTRALLADLYRGCGMQRIAQQTGITLNTDTGWKTLECPTGKLVRQFNIINPVAEADVVINLPKLKSHGMMTMSGAVKNLFGCIPGLQKPELHFRFPEQMDFGQMLLDLAGLVAPAITIVDAVESMEGDGPSAGEKRSTGITFASGNLYLLDRALCEFIGFDPTKVPTIARSIEQGLAPRGAGRLVYAGEGEPAPLRDFRYPASAKQLDFLNYLPPFLHGAGSRVRDRFLTPKPVIVQSKCIGCGKCAESCFPKAVTVQNRIAVIEESKCIKCYCCHEMCPVSAIQIKRTILS